MNEKISVKEYLEDNELLELNYIPYDEKVEICNIIINQCASVYDNYHTLNTVLLERVKTEIFISYITNLDLSIEDENGLNGYDQLCYNNELYNLLYECDYLYEQFEEILDLAIQDYNNNVLSLRGYLNTLKTNILDWFSILRNDAHEYINNLDSKAIADNIINIINKSKNVL